MLQGHRKALRRAFQSWAGKGAEEVDLVAFMVNAKNCGIVNEHVTLAKLNEIFLHANKQELHAFLSRMPDPEEIRQMSMDFEEYLDAMVAIACAEPQRFPDEPLAKRLKRVLGKVLGRA